MLKSFNYKLIELLFIYLNDIINSFISIGSIAFDETGAQASVCKTFVSYRLKPMPMPMPLPLYLMLERFE